MFERRKEVMDLFGSQAVVFLHFYNVFKELPQNGRHRPSVRPYIRPSVRPCPVRPFVQNTSLMVGAYVYLT